MFRHLGVFSIFALLLVGCSSKQPLLTTSIDPEVLKTSWTMEGRAPEWHITINGQRFHGSFPGRYEGRVMKWDVSKKENITYLVASNNLATIELTEEECQVANQTYTHSAVAKINQQTFTGCAKHRS